MLGSTLTECMNFMAEWIITSPTSHNINCVVWLTLTACFVRWVFGRRRVIAKQEGPPYLND